MQEFTQYPAVFFQIRIQNHGSAGKRQILKGRIRRDMSVFDFISVQNLGSQGNQIQKIPVAQVGSYMGEKIIS